MFCKNCGFDVGQNKFCTNCGAEVVAEPMQNAAPQQPNYGASQNTYNQTPGYGTTSQNTGAPNPGYNAAPQNAYNQGPGYGAPVYGAAPYALIEDFNLITAFQSFFKKYADFKGRSRRKEYWLAMAANYIITFLLSIIYYISFVPYVMNVSQGYVAAPPAIGIIAIMLLSIYSLAILIPSIAIVVRRLHDIGKSGWFYFISLIPCGIGPIIMLVFMCTDSQPGVNQYGPNPKGY